MTDLAPVPALLAALAGLAAGTLVPRLIARLPEPELDAQPEPDAQPQPDPEPDGRPGDLGSDAAGPPPPAGEPKEPYTDIAARPGLTWWAAAASGVCAALLGAVLGWDSALVVVLPLVPVGVALAVIDWRTRLLPTRLIAPAYAVTLVAITAVWLVDSREPHDLWRTALGWLVYGGLFFLLWFVHPRGLGYGDVRLSGVLGLALGWVGWTELLLGIWSGLVLGGVLGGVLALLTRRRDYPFGPFMLLGALAGVVLGQPVMAAVRG